MSQTSANKIRVVIADDHPLFLDGISALLKAESSIELVGTAANGIQVLELLQDRKVDVAVLDVNMPALNGLDTARKILATHLARVIILTTFDDSSLIAEMVRIGVSGYVLKSVTRDELVRAIQRVAAGDTYYSPEVQARMLDSYKDQLQGKSATAAVLTARETEIVKLLAKEYTNDMIAKELFISFRTVETHRKNIMQKTGSKNLAGLLKFAMDHKLL